MSFSVENQCHKRGIVVVPDIVANAGGVISSYVEHEGGDRDRVYDLIEEKISRNTLKLLEDSRASGRMPRKSSLTLAMARLREAGAGIEA
jgi:glutamate dehydrogenase/leucine dehydrogenase